MKNLKTLLSAAIAALACFPAVAQTRYCVGGDLDHLTAAERSSCNATLQAVKTTAAALHAPDGWHFVVVCGEDGWKQYAAFSTRGEQGLEDASADTDLNEHVTFLREQKLQMAEAHGLQRVVAHEIASIVLKTNDENAIQTQMATWERSSLTQMASLR